jgi:hypothetical protein
MILHGNTGELDKYALFSVLPDKIARFLYEYYDALYTSLGLPPIPLDRSGISIAYPASAQIPVRDFSLILF